MDLKQAFAISDAGFAQDEPPSNPLIPAQAGISGNLGWDSQHQIPGQARDERLKGRPALTPEADIKVIPAFLSLIPQALQK